MGFIRNFLFTQRLKRMSPEEMFEVCKQAAALPLTMLVYKINERIEDPKAALEDWISTFAQQKPEVVKDVEAMGKQERSILATYFRATDHSSNRAKRDDEDEYIAENVLHAWRAITEEE